MQFDTVSYLDATDDAPLVNLNILLKYLRHGEVYDPQSKPS